MLARLENFKTAVSSKLAKPDGESRGGNDEDLSDWAAVKLKFTREASKVTF